MAASMSSMMRSTLISSCHIRRLLAAQGTRAIPSLFSRQFCSSGDDSSDDEKKKKKKSTVNVPRPAPKQRNEAAPLPKQKSGPTTSDGDVDPNLVEAASGVGKHFGDEGDDVFSDLLTQLRSQAKVSGSQSVFSGMRVDFRPSWDDRLGRLFNPKQPKNAEVSHKQPQSILEQLMTGREDGKSPRKPQERMASRPRRNVKPINLYEGERLGIFEKKRHKDSLAVSQPPNLFDHLEKEELLKKSQLPPNNAFEEMIQWTKEGKLWKFPIDNEQGMESERDVPFYDNVFLDHLLEDFPSKGPVRHFMELVIVGLSKNPYLTVAQKHEHVAWYKNYFDEKKQILNEYNQQAEEEKCKLDELSS